MKRDHFGRAQVALRGVGWKTATRRARGSVELSDGTRVSGLLAGEVSGASLEYQLRDSLAQQLGGIIEATLAYRSRADVLTEDAVFEVKACHLWRRGARQVLAYSALCGKPPALALFGPIQQDAMLKLRLELSQAKLLGLRDASSGVALWWWTGSLWAPITAAAEFSDMPAGAGFGSCAFCGTAIAWLSSQGQDHACYHWDGRVADDDPHVCKELCRSMHLTPKEKGCIYCLAELAFPAVRPARPKTGSSVSP